MKTEKCIKDLAGELDAGKVPLATYVMVSIMFVDKYGQKAYADITKQVIDSKHEDKDAESKTKKD